MLMLPMQVGERVDLLIVLEEDQLDRIKAHDNAEIQWKDIPYRGRPGTIVIAYANAEEMVKIHKWAAEDNLKEAVKLLTSGWKYRPELGDHDFGPTPLKGKPH